MKRSKHWMALAATLLGFQAYAADLPAGADAEKERIRAIVKEVMREYAAAMSDRKAPAEAREILQEIVRDNRNFVRSHGPGYFQPFADGQHPRATVVTCSDSRVHSHALDATPDGDLFMIRNIGNQITTAEGSVEYGVHHLHTPVLLIVGHSACGAIKAASGDYGQESVSIRRELDSIQIPKGEGGISGVRTNVHNQVRQAMQKFEQEVMEGRLVVVGAIYDFRNELKQGQGRLSVINVNGESDPAKLARLDLLQVTDAPAEAAPASKATRPSTGKAPASH